MGLADPGLRVWLEPNEDPKKKLKFGWRLVEHDDGHFTGVDTSVPNRALRDALMTQQIVPLASYRRVEPERPYGENSRIDFLLTEPGLPDAYVEVKSVTLSRSPGLAEFPDSVTRRGAKHLAELSRVAVQGNRAVMLYLVQRTDCTKFTLARDLDPDYAAAYDDARRAGVETLCFGTRITPLSVTLGAALEAVT